MTILPAPPPATDRPAPGRASPTTGDAGGFAQLLAGHVVGDGRLPSVPSARPADDDVSEPPAGCGEVAAAVHAAVAAWRADPADVALGAHLRRILHEAVGGHTRPLAAGGVPAAEDDEMPASAGTGQTPAAHDLPVAAPAEVEASTPTLAAPVETPTAGPTRANPAASADVDTTVPVPADAPRPTTAPQTPVTEPASPDGTDGAARATAAPRVAAPTRRPDLAADPAPAAHPDPATVDTADVVAELAEPASRAPTVDPPVGPRPVTAAATLDRVLQAVEALEHAPPPRRMAIEVEGVQLTVAMQGDDVAVAVRGGAEQLPAGWQRELATALRGRGLGLAGEGATSGGDGRRGAAHDGRPDARSSTGARPAPVRPPSADADLRL